MKYYFTLIRWKNILMLLFIQWLMQFSVVMPILQTHGFEVSFQNYPFWLLAFATLCITAGGYIINDYFDVKIDRINRPENVIVGVHLSQKEAMRFYQITTFIGIFAGLTVAFWVKSITLALIFILTPGLLWFYSASYKRQFLIGNIIVSLLSAVSIFVVALLEAAQLKLEYGKLLFQTPILSTIYGWIGVFAIFAFLMTWIREIVKDLEDIEGDKQLECRTMAIKWGVKKTKNMLYILIAFVILLLLYLNFYTLSFHSNFTLRYAFFGIILPLIAVSFMLFKANTSKEFHQTASFLKIIMLIGVLYSLFFYFLTASAEKIPIWNLFIVQ